MSTEYVLIERSLALQGTSSLTGAKNAVLVIMASLLLTSGKSKLFNVPYSDDVLQMILLLSGLGAHVHFDQAQNTLEIDTSKVNSHEVNTEIMKKMRASILALGPLLARFGYATLALPGGCVIGSRPIDLHLRSFEKMGITFQANGQFLQATAKSLQPATCILEYPSVGATENILMAATLTKGTTRIINAALEPEVFDLIAVLAKMGARIGIQPPATIEIHGVDHLQPIEHAIIFDRLEAGSLLIAAAITQGEIALPQAPAHSLQLVLHKLEEMGHSIKVGDNGVGVWFKATLYPRAVSFKTMPYPGFPTDLQAPMMAALCLASGTSVIHETVFENRLLHVRELQKMGAQISIEGSTATIKGVDQLYGAQVIATDIRAACALVVAGLAAQGQTLMTGAHHLKRGYQGIVDKLASLGGSVAIKSNG